MSGYWEGHSTLPIMAILPWLFCSGTPLSRPTHSSVSDNPLKQQRSASDSERKAMTELLAREINSTGYFCDACGWELEQRRPSYTVNFLRFVRSLYPSARLSLLVGEDSWHDFSLWESPREIEELADVVVFARKAEQQGERDEPSLGVRFVDFSSPLSSTMLREMIANGESFSSLVPSSIERYIRSEGLYPKSDTDSQLH